MRFLMLFVLVLSLGCASTASSSKSEYQGVRVFNHYTLTLRGGLTLAPHEIEQGMEAVLKTLENGMKNKEFSEPEQVVITQFLSICKWVLGYEGDVVHLALFDHPIQSFFSSDGCIYLSVHNGPHQARRTLIHEFGHALRWERVPQRSALNPRWWFRHFPCDEVTEELWAEATIALVFQRIAAYSAWRPHEQERYTPFLKSEEPALWNYFLSWEYYLSYPNAEGRRFVNALRQIQSYDALMAFCAKRAHPKYALMRLCYMLLEAHFQNTEDLWVFLHTCDDEVLEEKINEILCNIPADLGVAQFIHRRRTMFR